VLCHVIQTLNDHNSYGIISTTHSTANIQALFIIMLQYSGIYGNTIFFICSAWFLLDSQKSNKRKILQMILDVWTVSVLILIGYICISKGQNIDFKVVIKSLFPTTFANNWYITCYILFYAIHPFLNKIIYQSQQKVLFRCVLVLSFLYLVCSFIYKGLFFNSELITWIAIYFIIAYMKLYLPEILNNKKFNIALMIIGFVGVYSLILITNYLGLHMSVFNDKFQHLQHWRGNNNPFMIMFVIGLFNIVRNIHFENKVINYLSKLSLLIYIIHENIIVLKYYRPMLWEYVYNNFGYDKVILWVFILTVLVFCFGLFGAILYHETIHKLVVKICNKLYCKIVKLYKHAEQLIVKPH
jgi:hypothetical protein